MPSTPQDARDLLINSIFDPNPVIFLEHRWLHNTLGQINKDVVKNIGEATIVREGDEITIISMSYLTIESLKAADYLFSRGLKVEIIDLCSIKPIDWELIFKSIHKTGRVLVCDTGFKTCSVSAELITEISTKLFDCLKSAPARLAMPDVPEPTSFNLTKGFYIRASDIAAKCLQIMEMDKENIMNELPEPIPHDVPGDWFKGPF